ncbi:MAG: hypothetical protein A2X79_02550 [Desulfuromonadaceae bacterium GWB2_53_15]|nr:MAG: hypothetical protein A2X79_02550 [Desulfuromonadaceae bacterium GWB2_53_15]
MTTLFTIMLTVTLIAPLIIAPKIDAHWMDFEIFVQEGNRENLHLLLKQINSWVMRHLACALIAVLLVAVLKYAPTLLEQPEQLATITGIYAIISIIFAFIESLLAQEIYNLTANRTETEKSKITAHTPRMF